MERVHCPLHAEETPSCVIYSTHAYCYGGCGRIELSALGIRAEGSPRERYKEDLSDTRKYINGLQTKTIRGFDLPYDSRGYYLVWPAGDYYKLRVWDKDAKNKYRGPAGHAKPPFWVRREHYPTLCLVEGEFNALSIGDAFPDWDVCSPGSASDFKTEKTRTFLLTYCTHYGTIIVVVDRDGPGTEAAIHAKGLLSGKVPDIRIVLCEQDANELYCEQGKEALKKEIEERLSQGL